MAAPCRVEGYVPIRDYAAIGDGRTLALVARDGSVDWLCLPDLDSGAVFAALLDAGRGGSFALAPDVAFEVTRRYLPGTNVLESTFVTATGTVRVTDAMTLPGAGLGPLRELARRVEGLAGTVPMAWRVEPCFGYGTGTTRIERRAGVPVGSAGADAVAVGAWEAGDPVMTDGAISGRFDATMGYRALLALAAGHQEPLVLAGRGEVERRLDDTAARWRAWAGCPGYDGPWRDAVVRSALALKLLVFSPSGALAAGGTTSLPEELGGVRNWDYRYCWVRDSAFVLEALLRLGYGDEAEAFFWWLLSASQLTHPRLQVLYRLNGGASTPERTLPLEGYRCSAPVRVGNAAADQLQLDSYGDLLQTAWVYAHAAGRLDRDVGRRLARTADLVARLWRQPDSGIWEVRSPPADFTHSKMMCWVALDRAVRLAEAGHIPTRNAGPWQTEADAVRAFVDERCRFGGTGGYGRAAGSEDLDASLLLGVLFGYLDPKAPEAGTVVEAVRKGLARGPFLYRYSGEDGLPGGEGAFLPCSFWLVDALARTGRVDEAARLMEELLPYANDVGLYAEEIDPDSGEFLGNFPQALTHLALVNAAASVAEAGRR